MKRGNLVRFLLLAAMVAGLMLSAGVAAALSDDKITEGLKEALLVGSGNAVTSAGKTDGYFKNEVIKILLPEKVRKYEKTMRQLGLGKQLDEFVLSMNRAAEKAAPSAKSIFWDAIKEMTFSDVKQIFSGGDTAATEYFRGKTWTKLFDTFKPVVVSATDEFGVTRKYKSIVGKTKSIPFISQEDLDIDSYVVNEALDGLFYLVGEEEKKIRKDPVTRITEILKDVFGSK
jgi:hypothetical protein